jgi:hypothetical protein
LTDLFWELIGNGCQFKPDASDNAPEYSPIPHHRNRLDSQGH